MNSSSLSEVYISFPSLPTAYRLISSWREGQITTSKKFSLSFLFFSARWADVERRDSLIPLDEQLTTSKERRSWCPASPFQTWRVSLYLRRTPLEFFSFPSTLNLKIKIYIQTSSWLTDPRFFFSSRYICCCVVAAGLVCRSPASRELTSKLHRMKSVIGPLCVLFPFNILLLL